MKIPASASDKWVCDVCYVNSGLRTIVSAHYYDTSKITYNSLKKQFDYSSEYWMHEYVKDVGIDRPGFYCKDCGNIELLKELGKHAEEAWL